MTRKKKRSSGEQRWLALSEEMRKQVPHLCSVLDDEEAFVDIRVKARPDGTTLTILKQYGSDGGVLVCFGSGYGVFGSLLAVDSTVQGNHWKVDKPYSP